MLQGSKVQGSRFKKSEQKPVYKPKRGTFAPLMKEEEKEKVGIHELSYDLACRITRLFQYLTEDAEYKEYVQSKQLYRSSTSIGANIRESEHVTGTCPLSFVIVKNEVIFIDLKPATVFSENAFRTNVIDKIAWLVQELKNERNV